MGNLQCGQFDFQSDFFSAGVPFVPLTGHRRDGSFSGESLRALSLYLARQAGTTDILTVVRQRPVSGGDHRRSTRDGNTIVAPIPSPLTWEPFLASHLLRWETKPFL